jgi:peptide/nickel transport system substrate-binding protein
MRRRHLLAAAATAALARPALGQANARTLKFIPEGNLQNPDPIWSTTTVARNFGYMIWDTLYGVDASLTPQPQMCEGHELSADKLTWRFRLRDGLKFHDGTPVLARDCTASITRWMKRDGFGQRIEAALDELRPIDDRRFEFRLKRPFPLLLTGLAHPVANVCFIMPERLAQTDPYKQIDEYVGSGPYRFLRDEWQPGARATFTRNEAYVPRQEPPSFVAGGKQANFDRIEWIVIPDAATAAAAMQSGEAEWWQSPTVDLLPVLRRARNLVVERLDDYGSIGVMRFNMLHPPFDNVKLRRAILPALNQEDFMNAAMGGDPELSRTGVGVFTPGSPLANAAGLETLTGKRDLELAKRLVAESGYKGERVVFCTAWEALNLIDPGSHYPIFGNGQKGWFGWMDSPRLEDLRTAWFDAPDLAAQKKVAEQIQLAVWEEVPYYPLGQYFQSITRRNTIEGIVRSPFPLFWNVRKA